MQQPSTTIAAVLSSATFLWYGIDLVRSRAMAAEFERYHLAPYRTLTGALQVAAAVGLLAGLRFRPLLLLTAGGLAGMMFVAIAVRLRAHEPPHAAIPAFLLLCLNLFIVATAGYGR